MTFLSRLPKLWSLFFISVVCSTVNAHIAVWDKGMYCYKGNKGYEDLDTSDAVYPLYNLTKEDWWFHHVNKCDEFPPAAGDYLIVPANGEMTVEMAMNRAQTSHSYNGVNAGTFPDGKEHPGLGYTDDGKKAHDSCISNPNLHTQNETMAAGSAFAISYTPDLKKVTNENLVVFSVKDKTPWKRRATFDVPNLPACPTGGCICAWGWVPNGCGIPNMYMEGFKCIVTNSRSTTPVAPAVPPVWCEDDQSKCVKGAKQMIFWHQKTGNNVQVDGYDKAGDPKSPAYNSKMGFNDGAQTDIFVKHKLPRSPSMLNIDSDV